MGAQKAVVKCPSIVIETPGGTRIEIREPANGAKKGPTGKGKALFDNVAETVPNSVYQILDSYSFKPPGVLNKEFDSCRNPNGLEFALNYPADCGIVSGRKPSGPCHFGHKLVLETLGFFQKNGMQIYVPMADLETALDPKIKGTEQYRLLCADNLLDWGASGLNLNAAHVYLQSEELRVMTTAYMIARGLTIERFVDIYGGDTLATDMCFAFAGMAQIGDMLLPQHRDFGKKASFMLSGPDQDGHMKMTMELAKNLMQRTGTMIQSVPASLYVRSISNLEGSKESASEPVNSIYLGSVRNVYSGTGTSRKLDAINTLTLEERIKDTREKIERFSVTHRSAVLESARRRAATLPEFSQLQICRHEEIKDVDKYLNDFVSITEAAIAAHQERRREVYTAALLRTLSEIESSHSAEKDDKKKEIDIILDGAERNRIPEIKLAAADKASITIGDPKMWDVPTEAYVPAELRGVKTSWYHQIARVADKIVV